MLNRLVLPAILLAALAPSVSPGPLALTTTGDRGCGSLPTRQGICADVSNPSGSRPEGVLRAAYVAEANGGPTFAGDPVSSPLALTAFASVARGTSQSQLRPLSSQPISEPATLTLLGTVLLALGAAARRRMKKSRSVHS